MPQPSAEANYQVSILLHSAHYITNHHNRKSCHKRCHKSCPKSTHITNHVASQIMSHHNFPATNVIGSWPWLAQTGEGSQITDHTTTHLLHTNHKSHKSHHISYTACIIASSHCRIIFPLTGKLWYVWLLAQREYPSHRQHHVFISPTWPEQTKDKTAQHALTAKVVNDVSKPQPCIAKFSIFLTSHIIPHNTLQSTSQIAVHTTIIPSKYCCIIPLLSLT